jgi:WD40 repeat protein
MISRRLALAAGVLVALLPPGACLGHEPKAVLQTGRAVVRCLAFSPDGRMLATGANNGRVDLWEVQTRKRRATFRAPDEAVFAVAFSPTGRVLAAGSGTARVADGTISLWELATGKCVGELPYGDPVYFLAFSPDGRVLASAGMKATVRWWDLAAAKEKPKLPEQPGLARSTVFSPDGKVLAAGDSLGVVRFWNAATGKSKAVLCRDGSESVEDVRFSPDGKLLASLTTGGAVTFWDTTGRGKRGTFAWRYEQHGFGPGFGSLAWSPDGNALAAHAFFSGGPASAGLWEVFLWDRAAGKQGPTLHGESRPVFSPDGRTLATVGQDGNIRLWSVPSLLKKM